ncbi:DUF4365 domain-containing protein [Spongiactinospora rosea]|uniref:DUF4365 domain-containing protein n=2 Tax=Spongiactinospora rosea TaxID=2248750 RepID=A0A366LMC5_9ACTN|nr:DUF4365 domain-containing protein [Spongiactinospora rosea]
MVVTAAGCWIKDHRTDVDGVDITIASSAEYETWYGPEFELQLKCTAQQDLLKDDHIVWQMKAEPLRKLINPKRFTPALLGVLLVPEDAGSWLNQSEEQLLLEGGMYWEYAAKLGEIPEGQGSKTVHLPRSNLFDVERLLGIMRTIGDGGGR